MDGCAHYRLDRIQRVDREERVLTEQRIFIPGGRAPLNTGQ
jgi:hypothetical protein